MKFTVNVEDEGTIENFFNAYAAQSLPSAGLSRLLVAYQNHGRGRTAEDLQFKRAAAAVLLRALYEMRALEDSTYSTEVK